MNATPHQVSSSNVQLDDIRKERSTLFMLKKAEQAGKDAVSSVAGQQDAKLLNDLQHVVDAELDATDPVSTDDYEASAQLVIDCEDASKYHVCHENLCLASPAMAAQ